VSHHPSRLRLDSQALISNWRWLSAQSGNAACGAAVKADGYGLGVREVVSSLAGAGCRDFYVATWREAEALGAVAQGASLSVLHGLAAEDLPQALASPARPVLNTPRQVRMWHEQAKGRPCDVMIDTGINRLGLSPADVAAGLLDGLRIETVMSHLACADEDHALNERQLRLFEEIAQAVPARRRSLANSAGICLGTRYTFDLTRPGLALYGGLPRPEAHGWIRPVVRVEAQIVQRRRAEAGEGVGYNATFVAGAPTELAILNIGYADGYVRAFSGGVGQARVGDTLLPVCGRVSMDLTAVDVSAAPQVQEGDWLELEYDLAAAAGRSRLSQYELLTLLGSRHERRWD